MALTFCRNQLGGEQIKRFVAHWASELHLAPIARIARHWFRPFNLERGKAFWTAEQINSGLLHNGPLQELNSGRKAGHQITTDCYFSGKAKTGVGGMAATVSPKTA